MGEAVNCVQEGTIGHIMVTVEEGSTIAAERDLMYVIYEGGHHFVNADIENYTGAELLFNNAAESWIENNPRWWMSDLY
ncbi:MAG: hypothetical protein JKY67_17440 [Pseudomonadales bacterium]|nr:hypothetical protein [Pseudomonadales bacterium]